MIFNNKKRKSVIEFFDYVEFELILTEKESEPLELVKKQIKQGRDLISNNEWGIAFENLSSELVEHFIIINRKGESLAQKVIKRCKLKEDWILKLRRLNSNEFIKGSWSLVDCTKLAKKTNTHFTSQVKK